MIKIAVIYYSSTGTLHALAEAVAVGAVEGGAQVRLRRAPELAPRAAIESNPAWAEHADTVAIAVPEATLTDLEWADGYAFGTPTRFGGPAAQLKQFLDTAGGLWRDGTLADKAVTSFTAASNPHGGQEATLLSLNNVFYHWGSIIVPVGYTDPLIYAAGGNPYGTSFATQGGEKRPDEAALAAASYQGRRLAQIAALLTARPEQAGVAA